MSFWATEPAKPTSSAVMSSTFETMRAPVERDGDRLGAVRVAQVVRYRPPVQNRYVRAMSLEDRWSRQTGELVRVRWTSTSPNMPHRALRGVGGRVLGYASVVPPSSERLVERTASFYTDLLVAWVVGLIGWGLVLVVGWYLRLTRREGLRRHRRARRAALWRLAVVALLAIGARYAILFLNVPARWSVFGMGGASLFDPTYFASTLGGGILRSIGDLLLTGLWAAGLAVGVVRTHEDAPRVPVRRFVVPYQKARSESKFYFETWQLTEPSLPDYIVEV